MAQLDPPLADWEIALTSGRRRDLAALDRWLERDDGSRFTLPAPTLRERLAQTWRRIRLTITVVC
jgi:hypothetical protein